MLLCLGIETLEPLKEWAWSCYSGILFGIHHLYVMQPVGIVSNRIIVTIDNACNSHRPDHC